MVKVCWGKPDTPLSDLYTPAVEASVFYDRAAVKIARAVFDPNVGRTTSNSFDQGASAGCAIDNVSYQFSSTVTFADLGIADTSDLLFARLRMFYNSDQNHIAGFDVTGQGNLPSQGLDIDSLGEAGSSNRRLEVFQSWPEPPAIFDYAIFSNSGLIKQ